MPPTILITRPDPASHRFADQIRDRLGCGVAIVISPLMRIEPTGTLPDLDRFTTLVFTSRNGVTAYADATERRDIPCYCVGDATARQARDCGITALSAAGTAGDLTARILREKVTGPCLHIRGEHAATDVAGHLTAAGIATEQVVLYRQEQQPLSPQAEALLTGRDPVLLPLFSPRSARIFFEGRDITAPLCGVAISENTAAAVPIPLSRAFVIAKKPDAAAMLTAIEALIRSGKALEGGKRAQ